MWNLWVEMGSVEFSTHSPSFMESAVQCVYGASVAACKGFKMGDLTKESGNKSC